MAKQIGIVKYSGMLDGMVHYKTKHGAIARSRGNVDRERIAKDPAFEGTRNGNAEFGYATRVGKLIRHGVQAITGGKEQGDTNTRLLAHIRKLLKLDNNKVAGKPRLTGGVVGGLKGFEWDKDDTISAALKTDYTLRVDEEEGRVVMELPRLVPSTGVRHLASATHVEFILGVCVVDFETDSQMSRCDGSHALKLDSAEPVKVIMSCDIPAKKGELVVIGLGMRSYLEEGEVMYPLREGHGYQIVDARVW